MWWDEWWALCFAGIQQKSCDLVCVLCELLLVDKMPAKVLMPLALSLIKSMLSWKSEVEVLERVSGEGESGR